MKERAAPTIVSWLKTARTVAGPAPGESALAALRRAFLDSAAKHDAVIGFSGPDFARMITESPALVARLREFHEEREHALAAVLAEEAGTSPDDVVVRVASAQLIGVHRVLFEETLRRTIAGEDHNTIAAAVTGSAEKAFDLLEPSLGKYAVRAEP
jgi:hypothetical protein